MQYHIPRITIAAVQGRSGKTTFTIGLLNALHKRGLAVQPFKKGPDYIDPSWAGMASGIPCRNLDAVMMTPENITHAFCRAAHTRDLAVVEGAMGIFDGLDVAGSNATSELAHLLKSPVILVVSGQRITRSVAAIINGVVAFDPRIQIAGIVLNQVARPRHQRIMTESIETYCKVPVLGALPKTADIEIPDRHLGLIPAGEQEALQARIDRLGDLVAEHVDLDRILTIAAAAAPLEDDLPVAAPKVLTPKPRIGVFKDQAFSFYYPENLEALVASGAETISINALETPSLPPLDGLYIGGGFPEVFADALAKNSDLRADVAAVAAAGMPIYAECGGLMYLSQAIVTDEGRFPMAGVFPCHVRMEKRPQGHGYAIQEATADNPFFPAGMTVKGHEFHHSRVEWEGPEAPCYGFVTRRGKGIAGHSEGLMDGLVKHNTLAAYHHFHAASSPHWAQTFVAKAAAFRNRIK